MNVDKCANCLMHGWKQVEDVSLLKQCKRCKVIKYCGKDCQTDHWKRLHHKHCNKFLDPANSERWVHKEDECHICREAAIVGESQIRRPENPNYECVFKSLFETIPPSHLHPHPFQDGAQSGIIYEKAVTVLCQLITKFVRTQPEAIFNWQEDMMEVFHWFVQNRLSMWTLRKTIPASKILRFRANFIADFNVIDRVVKKMEAVADPFQLWKIIRLVKNICRELLMFEPMNSLVNPLSDIPTEFHAIISEALSNSTTFLATTNKILEALATQVIPFEDVLKIVCDGSLEKSCSFCSKSIVISSISPTWEWEPSFRFSQMFCCDSSDCVKEVKSRFGVGLEVSSALLSAGHERRNMKCDFCFGLPPAKDVHRCSRCLTVMYCSKDCQNNDWKIHKLTCKEDVEERKKKDGGSGRRKNMRDEIDKLQKKVDGANVHLEASVGETVAKFRLKNTSKKNKEM